MKYTHLRAFAHPELSLATDLYQLTMAYGYWKNNIHDKEAVFHLFYRKNPFKGSYAIASGLNLAIDFLNNWTFDSDALDYLGTLKGADNQALFEPAFLEYLQNMEFSCDVAAIPEGSIVFANEPLVRIKGPLIQAQLIETTLLNLINFSTLVATKAARIKQAAKGDTILEFGFRRAQGLDGGLSASRAAYIGGCNATSNVLAGKIYDIPVKGTHAHSWVMCFDDELVAFQQYAQAQPNNCIFLVDTYDTITGVQNAIKIGHKLKTQGHEMLGIRLDSGDLAELSIKARALLNEAGFEKAAIVASNDLDEYRIRALKERNAAITVWGVGTKLATAYDQAALGGVYKLAAIRDHADAPWNFKIKRSEEVIKTSNPGILEVRRFYKNGIPVADQIVNLAENNFKDTIIEPKSAKVLNFAGYESKKLLQTIFNKGKLVYTVKDVHEIRAFCQEQQRLFSDVSLENYSVGLEEQTHQLKSRLQKQIVHS